MERLRWEGCPLSLSDSFLLRKEEEEHSFFASSSSGSFISLFFISLFLLLFLFLRKKEGGKGTNEKAEVDDTFSISASPFSSLTLLSPSKLHPTFFSLLFSRNLFLKKTEGRKRR